MSLGLSRKLLSSSKIYFSQVRGTFSAKHYIPKKFERPNIYKSLQERIDDDNYMKDNPELYKEHNIGFPVKSTLIKEKRKKRFGTNPNKHLEKLSRNRQLQIDLDAVEDGWTVKDGIYDIANLARHYGIFKDLFGPFAYFHNTNQLNVEFDFDEESVTPVYYGNLIKPKEASKQPNIYFESKPDELWSVLLVSPDNNLLEENTDFLHWFVGNISGNDLKSGEVIMDYMPPIPPKGTGFHRYVFLLFKQTRKVDFSSLKQEDRPCLSLPLRNFSTYGFYKENEEVFTPSSVCWFQADWDSSTKEYFHNTLEMKEPIYEYEFPKMYLKTEVWYPTSLPFNRYLDLRRDPKEVAKEVLLKRLENISPFEEEKIPEFPGALPIDENMIVWEQEDLKAQRLGFGKYKDMYRGRIRPELLPAEDI